MSRIFLSDDGTSVIIIDDDDNTEVVSVQDYIEENGYEGLVSIMTEAQKKLFLPELNSANIAEYYRCIIDVAYKNGRLNQLIGLYDGAINGSRTAVKATAEYFDNNGDKLTRKIMAQRVVYLRALARLSEAMRAVGFGSLPWEKDGPVPEGRVSAEKLNELMNEKSNFREKLRKRATKHAAEGEAVSLENLVQEVLSSYKK